ncbi:IclR family transcriptional regulator [Sphaerobacter sp.]|uniref:IclR family transcriptional regulator n=1 Tax=Sphaerobacter sp. TaxID=2099654 RepID=UPI001DC6C771|nr:IclR family transcriptional regulator [Sphaerobacter sp.]MBX5446830.1 IclR family transcriptional regulator [Sphaerobacter sp.]
MANLEAATDNGRRSVTIRSVENALSLLSLFSVARPTWSLTEISRELGLGKSTVFRLLATLEACDFVRRDPDTGRYSAAPRLWEIACSAFTDTGLREVAPRFLAELVDLTGETAYCSILTGRRVVHVEVRVPGQALRLHANVGDSFDAHAVASGKAILAFSPREVVEEYIAGGLPRRTSQTITDPDRFRAELAVIRQRGYAENLAEWEEDVRGAAAPVWDRDGQVIAAISVAGPMFRLTADLSDLGRTVRTVANEMSRALGAPEHVLRDETTNSSTRDPSAR